MHLYLVLVECSSTSHRNSFMMSSATGYKLRTSGGGGRTLKRLGYRRTGIATQFRVQCSARFKPPPGFEFIYSRRRHATWRDVMRNGAKESVNWYRPAFLRLAKLIKRGGQLSSKCGTGFPFPLPVWGVYTRVLPLVVPRWCNRGNRPLCGKFRKGCLPPEALPRGFSPL